MPALHLSIPQELYRWLLEESDRRAERRGLETQSVEETIRQILREVKEGEEGGR